MKTTTLYRFAEEHGLVFWQNDAPINREGYFVHIPQTGLRGWPVFGIAEHVRWIEENGYRDQFVSFAVPLHPDGDEDGAIFVFREVKAAVHFKLRFG